MSWHSTYNIFLLLSFLSVKLTFWSFFSINLLNGEQFPPKSSQGKFRKIRITLLFWRIWYNIFFMEIALPWNCLHLHVSTTKLNPSCNLDIPKYLMFRFKNISKKLCMCKSRTDICKIQAFYLAYVEHIYNIFGTIRLHELYVYLMMVFLEKKEENWMVIWIEWCNFENYFLQ